MHGSIRHRRDIHRTRQPLRDPVSAARHPRSGAQFFPTIYNTFRAFQQALWQEYPGQVGVGQRTPVLRFHRPRSENGGMNVQTRSAPPVRRPGIRTKGGQKTCGAMSDPVRTDPNDRVDRGTPGLARPPHRPVEATPDPFRGCFRHNTRHATKPDRTGFSRASRYAP